MTLKRKLRRFLHLRLRNDSFPSTVVGSCAGAGTQGRPYETTIMPRIPRWPLMGHRK